MLRRTDAEIELLVDPGRHWIDDNLWLQVRDAAHRSWLVRYSREGVAHDMGLGSLDRVPPETARAEAKRWREVLKAGRDPLAERQRLAEEAARRRAAEKTFAEIVEIVIEKKAKDDWDSPRSGPIFRNSLKKHAYPVLEDMRPQNIEAKHVVKVLEPIWKRVPETARRVRARIEQVMDEAQRLELREGENPARWAGVLDKRLDKPKRKKKKFPALPWKQIGVFMEHLRSLDSTGARALEFLILTVARSGMVRQAMWTEIDFAERVWHVPARHMKNKEPFDIPLSDAALAVLQAQAGGRASPVGLIFPGIRRGRPLSDMTLSRAVRRMSVMPGGTLRYQDPKYERPPVPHGFRSSFRDYCHEATGFPRLIAEMALAHEVGDDVEAAYLRGTAFEIRRMLMDAWATFCGRGKRPWSVAELCLRPGLDLPGASIEMLGPALQPLLASLLREALRGGAQAPSPAEYLPGASIEMLGPALQPLLASLLREAMRGAQPPSPAG